MKFQAFPRLLFPGLLIAMFQAGPTAPAADESPGSVTPELQSHRLSSPDKSAHLTIERTTDGALTYSLRYRDNLVLEPSSVGFVVQNGPALTNGFKLTGMSKFSRDERWRPVAGERAEIRDHFNAINLQLASGDTSLELEFRVYDTGMAFRYTFGRGLNSFTIADELSEFRFAGDHPCWQVYSAQGVYSRAPISALKPGCERPLTVELPGGTYAALGEAGLINFARMKFQRSTRDNAVRANLSGPVTITGACSTPWRFVLLADSAGQLMERNDLVLNLNAPCAIADTSWIKPGAVIREVTLTTDGGKACVDFATRMGIAYVEFDAGWYGHEYSDESDARAVNLDPKRSKGPLDLAEVIRYGKERGVGVILYVNRRALEKQLDEILPLYEKWGVAGVKYGFVNVGSQRWTSWLHEAVRKAAQHHLVVDIHDEYRPTGVNRTWPNLLTQEGVRGNEEMPPAEHNLVLPFTRFLCGAADYTFCWNDKRLKTTRSHQLAASVVFFSPLQFLFWYDRPSQIADEPALEFWRGLPVTWDDTRVLEGTPGDYVSVARRKGSSWYLAAMNGAKPRQVEFPLDFLDPGAQYQALICTDGEPNVTVQRQLVRTGDVLKGKAAGNGGYVARLTKVAQN